MKAIRFLMLFLIGLLPYGNEAFAQAETEYKPFSILIICPDSIELDRSLEEYVDTVEASIRASYYEFIRMMEVEKLTQGEEDRRETELGIQKMKGYEMEVTDYRYYELIPRFTAMELYSFFSGKMDAEVYKKSELVTYDFVKMAKYYEVDYILNYKKISTPFRNGEPVLEIVAELFSTSKSKVVFESTTYGHTGFYKDTRGVLMPCENDLLCLIESGMTVSSVDLFNFLASEQLSDEASITYDLIMILDKAFKSGQLPQELVDPRPSLLPWTDQPFIVVKSDTILGVTRKPHESFGSDAIVIFDDVEIFERGIQYALKMLKVNIRNSRASIKFKTVRFPTNDDSELPCHLGKLNARKVADGWEILRCYLKETECVFDFFGRTMGGSGK